MHYMHDTCGQPCVTEALITAPAPHKRAWLRLTPLTPRFTAVRVRLALQKYDEVLKAMYQVLSGPGKGPGFRNLLRAALNKLASEDYVTFISASGDKQVSAATAGCFGCCCAPWLREHGGERLLSLHPASSCGAPNNNNSACSRIHTGVWGRCHGQQVQLG